MLPRHDMAVAVLSSGGSSMTNQLLANDMLLHALKEKGTIAEFKPEKSYGTSVKADMPENLLKHAGIYGMTNQLIQVDISKAGEMTVSMQMPEYPAEKYVYTADGSFISADGNTKVSFVTEENGCTFLWSRLYISLPGLGQMALSHYSGEKLAAMTYQKKWLSPGRNVTARNIT